MFKFLKWANFQSSTFWLWKNPMFKLYNTSVLLGLCTEKWNVWNLCKKACCFLWACQYKWNTDLNDLIAINTFYGWVCLIFPWCYVWNSLLFAMGVDNKVTGDSKHVLSAMVVIVTMWRNDQSNTKKNGIVCTEGIYRKCQFILYSRSICWIDPSLTLHLPLIDTWSTLRQHFGWCSINAWLTSWLTVD